MPRTWTDDEPGFFALRHELSRLAARANRRPWPVLAGALAITAIALVMGVRAPHRYTAQITVRVTEVIDFHLPRSQWTDRELRSFITQVAFTNEVLTRVYREHVHAINPAPNVVRGVEFLRDAIEVTAVRSRTLSEAQGSDGPRSAYLVLRYGAGHPDKAMAVLKALAQPIMETSARRRKGEAEQELARVTLALDNAKAVLSRLRDQALSRAARPMEGAGSISPVRMMEIDSAIKEAQLRVKRYQEDKDLAVRRQHVEKQRPGIDFAISQESIDRPLPRLPVLLVIGVLTFLFAMPISALVIGAWTSTIDSLDDIRKLGIPVLGRLPRLVPAAAGMAARASAGKATPEN